MIPQGKAVTMDNTRNSLSEIARKHIVFAVLSVIAILIFYKPLSALVAYSLGHESASHILLIPVITVYLLYIERKRIFQSTGLSIISGGVVILIGIGFYWLANPQWESAEGNDGLVATTLSFVVIWIGAFLLCYGSRAARAAAFPLLFLLLMVPLPEAVLEKTIYLLQQGSTEVAYLLFKLVQVPVFRQGFILSLPSVSIEVAKECSGIRSSVALFITCLLAGHLFLRTHWKMALFVLLALPLGIIKNGIRITTLTLLAIYVDPSFLKGNLHRDGGFVFFLLALAMLAPVLLLLEKSDRTAQSVKPIIPTESGVAPSA
jgi:exosortase